MKRLIELREFTNDQRTATQPLLIDPACVSLVLAAGVGASIRPVFGNTSGPLYHVAETLAEVRALIDPPGEMAADPAPPVDPDPAMVFLHVEPGVDKWVRVLGVYSGQLSDLPKGREYEAWPVRKPSP